MSKPEYDKAYAVNWHADFWGISPCQVVKRVGDLLVVRFGDGRKLAVRADEIHASEAAARAAHGVAIIRAVEGA